MTTTPVVRALTLTERVAEEIRAMMGRRRVTGARLARELGVSDAWVSYRLSGKQTIDLGDLERFAEALDVEVADLIPPIRRQPTVAYLTGAEWLTERRADRPANSRPAGRANSRHATSGPPGRRSDKPESMPGIRRTQPVTIGPTIPQQRWAA